jgi:hypothetical protein
MRNNRDTDSNLVLAVGLLSATVVAALVVLVLPAVANRQHKSEVHPSPELITTSDKLSLDTAPAFQPLPKAQRPPETLLDPSPQSPSAIASSR